MPSNHQTEQMQENKRASNTAADGISRELWSVAKALEGTADRMAADGEADYLLLQRAVGLILQASRSGFIDSLVKLREKIPEAIELLDEPRPTPPTEAPEPEEQSIQESANSGDGEWRRHLTQVRIDEMLRQIARDGDPAEADALSRRRLQIHVLAKLWSYLSDTYPDQLSPRVAAIKHELLPGVDPWLGGERDFRKAAWVCTLVATEIDERCDLSIAEASKLTGVLGVTITRALKHIKNNGKKGREVRVNPKSLLRWKADQYDVGAERRRQQKRAIARLRRDKVCPNPECKETFHHTTVTICPHCKTRLVIKN